MLKVDVLDVQGFSPAITGMRNPMNSWNKSDSKFEDVFEDCENLKTYYMKTADIGENDLDLMKRLFKAGTEHRKFARMIVVYMDITAPLYWWKEFDTYKVGTVANSCSTMHKIHSKEFTLDDFSHEHLTAKAENCLMNTIEVLNDYRNTFLDLKDKRYWWQMIQLLPSSYNQKRTVMLNYEVCANILKQRKNHKLDEWHTLCDEILKLPYFSEIISEK